MGIRQKQRAVIEFVVLGGKSPINIFRILEKIRGDPAIAAVKKWLSRIKGEEEDLSLSDLRDRRCSGHSSSAVNPENGARIKN